MVEAWIGAMRESGPGAEDTETISKVSVSQEGNPTGGQERRRRSPVGLRTGSWKASHRATERTVCPSLRPPVARPLNHRTA